MSKEKMTLPQKNKMKVHWRVLWRHVIYETNEPWAIEKLKGGKWPNQKQKGLFWSTILMFIKYVDYETI